MLTFWLQFLSWVIYKNKFCERVKTSKFRASGPCFRAVAIIRRPNARSNTPFLMGLLKAKAQRPLGPCVYLSTHPSRGHCPFPPSSSLRRRRAAEMAHRAPVAAASGGGGRGPMYPASADPASVATPATFQRYGRVVLSSYSHKPQRPVQITQFSSNSFCIIYANPFDEILLVCGCTGQESVLSGVILLHEAFSVLHLGIFFSPPTPVGCNPFHFYKVQNTETGF